MYSSRTTIVVRALVCLALLAAILFILFVLVRPVIGADVVTRCSATRGSDRGHWAWREVAGRKCWYIGETGRAKELLRWIDVVSPSSNTAVGRPEVAEKDTPRRSTPDFVAEPTIESESNTAEAVPWQATPEDQFLAFTCCWPELTTPSALSTPSPTPLMKSQDRLGVPELPRATPPSQTIWPLIFLPVIVIAVSVLFAKRRLT